jgi:tRNA dimethylallyltransferase
MLAAGLIEEVKLLSEEGYHKNLVSMQGLGYKEVLAYLEGECSLGEAVELIKRDTRHFAKRQITWFKREKEVIWLDKDNYSAETDLLKDMITLIEEKQIL